MNNSRLTENSLVQEQVEDIKPMLRSRQEEIAKFIEAIDAISQSNYWKVIEPIFNNSLQSAVNQLCVEKDNQKRDVLQGEIKVLSRYANFKGLSEAYRLELKGIEQKLK